MLIELQKQKKQSRPLEGSLSLNNFTRGTYDFVGIADGLNDAKASALKGIVVSSGDFEN